MFRTIVALTAVAVLPLTAACNKKKEAAADPPPPPLGATGVCPKEPDRRFELRYALGTVPDHRVPGLGEAPKCHAVFPDAPVFGTRNDRDGKPEKFLANEGVFRGGCAGTDPLYVYEAVKVAKIDLDEKPLEFAAGKDFFLHVRPFDRCGFPLWPGQSPGWNARWTMGPGCETVITPKAFDEKTVNGFQMPADEVMIAAVAAGTCTLTVDFHGTKADFTLTVK